MATNDTGDANTETDPIDKHTRFKFNPTDSLSQPNWYNPIFTVCAISDTNSVSQIFWC